MPNKTFQTRISLKYDTYENWSTNNPVLLVGEIAITTVPTAEGSVSQVPAVMIKSGDGVSNYNDLPWASALAADVYPWAKAATKPVYQASEISGLEDFISGEIQDTNTKYQIVASGTNGIQLQSQEIGTEDWTNVGEPITITYTLAEGSANGTVSFNGVDVPVHGLGSAAYEEASAFDAAGAAAAVLGTPEDPQTANTVYGVKAYVDYEVTNAMADVTAEAQELINGLDSDGQTAGTGEVISAVSQTDGVITVQKKTLAAADIPTIEQTQVNGLTAALAGKQDTLVFNTAYNAETNKAATMTDVQNAVAGLSGAMHYVGESTTDPTEEGGPTIASHEGDYQAGDVCSYESKEYVYDGENWRELGDESSYAVKGAIVDADIAPNANIAQSKIANLVTDLAAKATPVDITSAIQALDASAVNVATGNKITSIEEVDGVISVQTGAIVAADIPELPTSKITGLDTRLEDLEDAVGEGGSVSTQIQTAIQGLDKADAAVSGQFVTQVVEEDGIITVTRAALTADDIPEIGQDKVTGLTAALAAKADASSLAAIATSGNMQDLQQTSGDLMILNCGSSSVNV